MFVDQFISYQTFFGIMASVSLASKGTNSMGFPIPSESGETLKNTDTRFVQELGSHRIRKQQYMYTAAELPVSTPSLRQGTGPATNRTTARVSCKTGTKKSSKRANGTKSKP